MPPTASKNSAEFYSILGANKNNCQWKLESPFMIWTNNVVLCDYFTPKSDDFEIFYYSEIEIMEHGHKPKVINMEQ